MGKISKYGNLYDKAGNLLRSCDENGELKSMTLKEVSDLVDNLGSDKDENGHIKDSAAFNNASKVLMNMYNDPKYAKERADLIKQFNDRLKVDKEKVNESLKETAEELENKKNDSEYADYEEVTN